MDPVRDLTFVKDTVRGFVKAAEVDNVVGEVFNIGTGSGISIGDLITKIMKIVGKNIPVEQDHTRVRPEKSEVRRLICGSDKAKEQLGWEPEFTFEQGLSETIDFIQNHPELYKPDVYNI